MDTKEIPCHHCDAMGHEDNMVLFLSKYHLCVECAAARITELEESIKTLAKLYVDINKGTKYDGLEAPRED
jgi:hypothetical protein